LSATCLDRRLALPPSERVEEQNDFGETICYHSPAYLSSTEGGSQVEKKDTEVPSRVGRYEIRDVLGRGAFGAVYLAFDAQLQRKVAIKVPLLRAMKRNPEETEKEFLQEARQLAQLTHTSIVAVHDVGVDDGRCYIVSEYLDGPDLNNWIKKEQPDWQESVRIVAALADGLAAAHIRNTIHRDVKPANIIVTDRPEGIVPVLVDFGLALNESTSAFKGEVVGTPNYMSPEQANGRGHRIDGRTDIYALGVILYRMLSGQLPFRASSISELLQKVVEDEPRPPRQFVKGIPKELERICLKAMAKKINDRYTTASDLADELRQLFKETDQSVTTGAQTGTRAKQAKKREKPKPKGGVKILIAEDHELTRFKLKTDLERWGHDVTAAEDGEKAWEYFQKSDFEIVITDLMMPKVNGLELVQRIRAEKKSDYAYIILLTAKAEKHDIVAGMGAGADDFLSKPFHRDELHVRLRAGTRITKLNKDLNETNRRVKRSLEAAAKIQRSYLPKASPDVPGFDFAWEYKPCEELGGDMLNIVQLDDVNFGLYVLEVNGNGVPASLLATSVSKVMSSANDFSSILVEREDHDPTDYRILDPAEVAEELNRRYVSSQEAGQFFTLVYGVLNIETREFTYTIAGHPPIVYQHADGECELLDISGIPIGLVPESDEYVEDTVVIQPGDRLLLYSNGLSDTANEEGDLYGIERLLEVVNKTQDLKLKEIIDVILSDLAKFRKKAPINDDICILTVQG
jgi:sigma-B regulation protein RsbU (phosphoserine phosphatase)